MGSFGGWEILLIFLVVLLVFGAKRIPEIARGLGKGIREFKDATSNIKSELSVDDEKNRIHPPRQGTTAPRHDPYQSEPAHGRQYDQPAQSQPQPAQPPQGAPQSQPPHGAPQSQPQQGEAPQQPAPQPEQHRTETRD